jgi:hypothetical protein
MNNVKIGDTVTILGKNRELINGKLIIIHSDGMVTIEFDDMLYTGYLYNK